jgi:uncharacterized membrane protein YidH (DUF202 family)
MSSWIDFSALWRIIVASLLFGAGLPALFGIGLRVLSPAGTDADSGGAVALRTSKPRIGLAAICFAVVLAAVGYGIYLIVSGA